MKPMMISLGLALAGAGCAGKAVPTGETMKSEGSAAQPAAKKSEVQTPHAVLQTSKGKIVVRLLPADAPKTVENFIGLATGRKEWIEPNTGQQVRRPLYNGTLFHRVIPSFMIQGGDPLGNGTGGPGYRFEDEFSRRGFDKSGLLAMANAGPNTNGSQFFITVAPTPWLNNRHTIFGEVIEGQDVADVISTTPRDGSDRPLTPVILKEVTIEYR